MFCCQIFERKNGLVGIKVIQDINVRFECDMNAGAEEATAWGCDLTYDYVKINADYRS